MAKTSQTSKVLLLFAIIWATFVVQGYGVQVEATRASIPNEKLNGNTKQWASRKLGRVMIGSTAPNCTYNECRGCKYNKCRAEQIPVEGNDPINSPYHYKCVCHR